MRNSLVLDRRRTPKGQFSSRGFGRLLRREGGLSAGRPVKKGNKFNSQGYEDMILNAFIFEMKTN